MLLNTAVVAKLSYRFRQFFKINVLNLKLNHYSNSWVEYNCIPTFCKCFNVYRFVFMLDESWGFHVMVVMRVQKGRILRHTPTAKIWAWIVKVLPFVLVLIVIFAMCIIAITHVSSLQTLLYICVIFRVHCSFYP